MSGHPSQVDCVTPSSWVQGSVIPKRRSTEIDVLKSAFVPSQESPGLGLAKHNLGLIYTHTPSSRIDKMHILLLGATGRTGKHVVSQLLSQGHTIVALVRAESKLVPQPGLTIVTGTPLSKPNIRRAVHATPGLVPSAAIITLNTVRASDSPFAAQLSPPRFLADSTANACAVLREAGVARVVVMSTVGAGDSWAKLPWLNKAFLGWTNIRYALEDHNLVDREIRSTELDWTLVRASRLEFDDAKQKTAPVQTLDATGAGMRMADSVSVASAATFLIKVAVEGLFVKQAVVIRD
ncbi:hypothetical protein JDV02_010720 [Purpureocillium takamizusanense]|uniref:NAD(P)-binding domain-containing protein n=1 Tax=Purpureocillium takamizusanense TaxID=2060973 RepID=A0A9Q8QV15_9HYPO|nr:uncharacterized protein JDV02_010720 [Purpureocillium takamizusanense]UNI25012.1 hypothetical protein JDV02_010720 [Purpureocillium takamizusanense]